LVSSTSTACFAAPKFDCAVSRLVFAVLNVVCWVLQSVVGTIMS